MKLGTRSRMARGGALGVLGMAVVLAAPAFACSPQANLSASTTGAAPGATIGVQGSSFEANGKFPATVRLVEESAFNAADKKTCAAPACRPLGNFLVDEQGKFAGAVTIPSDTQPGHYLLAAWQVSERWGDQVGKSGTLEQRFKVLAPGEQPEARPAQTQSPQAQEPTQPAQTQSPQGEEPAQPAQAQRPAPQQSAAAPAPTRSASPVRGPVVAAPAPRSPQPAQATAPAAAAPAPAAPVEPSPAPVAAPAPEPPVEVSKGTATSDLWSGFKEGGATTETAADRPASSVDSTGSFAAGLVLFLGGALALLAGIGVATARRARARAQR